MSSDFYATLYILRADFLSTLRHLLNTFCGTFFLILPLFHHLSLDYIICCGFTSFDEIYVLLNLPNAWNVFSSAGYHDSYP